MDKSVTKGKGVEILLKYYGFNQSNCIAFGDNSNDIDMIKFVAYGIVVNNAPDYVKKIAKNVTDSNNESGIYKYLVKNNIIDGL